MWLGHRLLATRLWPRVEYLQDPAIFLISAAARGLVVLLPRLVVSAAGPVGRRLLRLARRDARTRLRSAVDAEASSRLTRYSSKVQQPQRTLPTTSDQHWPRGLRQRPPATFPPLDGKEKVQTDLRSRAQLIIRSWALPALRSEAGSDRTVRPAREVLTQGVLLHRRTRSCQRKPR